MCGFGSTPAGLGADDCAEAAWCGRHVPRRQGAMFRKIAAFGLLLIAGGCRMCSDCCDYSSPVPGGLPMSSSRAGSNLGESSYLAEPVYVEAPVPMPTVVEAPAAPITP
jgi:hypothetical protein